MKSDQVIAAFRYFVDGNTENALTVLRQIEAHESHVGNSSVARSIHQLLSRNTCQMIRLPDAPPSIAFWGGSRDLASLVLSEAVRREVTAFIREWENRELLRQHGLPIRQVLLFRGPSGNGKTALAQAIATKIGLPLGILQYAHVIDSYRGASLGHLDKAMRFVNSHPCVLLIDEADSLVSTRLSRAKDSGVENNRDVNAVLMHMDALGPNALVIFATNMGDDLDSALVRRVGVVLDIEAPGDQQKTQLMEILERQWPMIAGSEWRKEAMEATSFAGVEQVALSAAREVVLKQAEKGRM
jgi:SpoVK/Ycf46/Vps4 family AAA+-type ATPase